MNSFYKRLVVIICAIVMVMSSSILFNGCSCSKGQAAKIMNLSLNPEIEFVLDEKDKVVSVTAINDEGNYIITRVDFVGMTAKEATEEFLNICTEKGYLTDMDNEDAVLKISISGEFAEEEFNNLKVVADKCILDLEINATVVFAGVLDKDYIASVVGNCMREYSQLDIQNKTESELIRLLAKSREETKNMLSQEAKELYYKSRSNEIIKQKYIKIKQIIEANNLIAEDKKQELVEKITNLINSFDSLKTKYEELFINAESSFQLALKSYYTKKKELLKAGIDKLSQTQKSIIIGQLETLKTTIQTAKSAADITLMAFENATSMALSAVELWLSIDNASSLIDEAVVNQTIENTKASYKDTFYTKYQSYVSASAWQSYWNILEPTNA